MTDPIREALERLVNTSAIRDREWHDAMCYARKVLADTPRAALAAPPPADAPPPAPVAWCSSDDFVAAAEKRQSFSGWREQYHDCDMALYAAPPPAPACDGKQNVHRELAQWLEQHRQPAQPPAPAPSSTLDLDALLSPEGAYARGTGHEDGAQMVSDPNGPEWWAPLYGCDTLDNLLDRLRARILPYLRPPIVGIDVPGCDGDYGDVMDLCAAEGVDPRVGVPLLKRAQEAWAAALLRQPAPAPAAVPVPVAERPWEREEWCDAQGRCWWSHGPTPTARWSLLPMDGMDDAHGWLLPHWAIPIPQPPQGEEVQP